MLKLLFQQYDDGKGVAFGSRWMKSHGIRFMGSPEEKGLGHLRKDLRKYFYYIKPDRRLPVAEELKDWQNQSILLAQYRAAEEPEVSRASSYVMLVFCFICVALAALFNGCLLYTSRCV